MKILKEKLVESVVDRICDICEESVMINNGNEKLEECGELHASFGCGSKLEDGNKYHLDLCEKCFKVALFALRDYRRSIAMFDNDLRIPDETFGLEKRF